MILTQWCSVPGVSTPKVDAAKVLHAPKLAIYLLNTRGVRVQRFFLFWDIYFGIFGIVFEFFNECDEIFLDLYKEILVKEGVFTASQTCSFMDTTIWCNRLLQNWWKASSIKYSFIIFKLINFRAAYITNLFFMSDEMLKKDPFYQSTSTKIQPSLKWSIGANP